MENEYTKFYHGLGNLIPGMRFLSDDKVSANCVYYIHPCRVIITLVNNLECVLLNGNFYHCNHIVNFCNRDMIVCRYLDSMMKLCMNSDSTIVSLKASRVEKDLANLLFSTFA